MKSIKIVGLSGVGKSTLIHAAQQARADITHIGFSDMRTRFGAVADKAWDACFRAASGVVLVDDHLEYGQGGLADKYRRENTSGILMLDCPLEILLSRRSADQTRRRDTTIALAEHERWLLHHRAEELANELRIPLLRLQGTCLQESFSALDSLIVAARRT